MIVVIRISGLVEVPEKINETLFRIRLRRKYSTTLLTETEENLALLKKVRDYVAYGKIDSETLRLLIEKRAVFRDKKKNPEEIISLLESKGLKAAGIKPFFRLHPPRGGIDSKIHFGKKKGVLGDNGLKINELIRRML